MTKLNTLLKNSFFVYYLFSVTAAIYALSNGANRIMVLFGLLSSTILFNITLENTIPYNKPSQKKPYLRDFGMVVLNILLTAKLGDFLMLIVLGYIADQLSGHSLFDTTELGPIYIQVIIAFLFVELIRYWTHYLQHKIPFLWKLHSVHHSVEEIYSLNNYYTHPVDYILRNILSFPIIALFGFSYEVISIVAVLSTIGMFAHSGADYNLGFFNYIFSTNRLHRWHHSAIPEEADNNFGASLIIWDQIFGTFYLPKDRLAPEHSGLLEDHPEVPKKFFEIVFYPIKLSKPKIIIK
jgi:ornithine lipid hydroxylase